MAMEAARVVAGGEGEVTSSGGKSRLRAVGVALAPPPHHDAPQRQQGGAIGGVEGEAAGRCQVTGNRNTSFPVGCAKVKSG